MRPTLSSLIRLGTTALVVLAVSSCETETATSVAPDHPDVVQARKSKDPGPVAADPADAIRTLGEDLNAQLAADGSPYRLGMVEWYTGADEAGQTVFFNNRGNKQLTYQFVPGDPRRDWSGPVGPGDDITWASDLTQGDAGPGLGATQTAIGNAMATWDSQACSTLPVTFAPSAGDIGWLEFFFSPIPGGSPVPAADVVHGGFGTGIDLFLPPPIIAATYTIISRARLTSITTVTPTRPSERSTTRSTSPGVLTPTPPSTWRPLPCTRRATV